MSVRLSVVAAFAMACVVMGSSVALADSPEWKTGTRLSAAAGDAGSTQTLTLVCGSAPGDYVLPEAKALLRLSVYPETAEAATPLVLESSSDNVQKLVAPRIAGLTVSINPFDRETFIAEITTAGKTGALIEAVVLPADEGTTITVVKLPAEPTVIIEGDRGVRVLQMFAGQVFGRHVGNSTYLVAPLRGGETAKLAISLHQRDRKDLPVPQLATPKVAPKPAPAKPAPAATKSTPAKPAEPSAAAPAAPKKPTPKPKM